MKPPQPPVSPADGGERAGDDDHPSLTPAEQTAARRAAQAKFASAISSETTVSRDVTAAVEANGGRLERFDSRIKRLNSLWRKVQSVMVDDVTDAEDAAAEISDALRYTAVLDESGYWARGNEIGAALQRAGYRPAKQTPGWHRFGYRGRNDTFISPDGFEFEIQLHTAASLDAAERTHPMYEERRLPTTRGNRNAELKAMQDEIFAAVPAPDDVKWVD